jgi:23S rRNA (adenine(2503)-C(2))-methyltransferase
VDFSTIPNFPKRVAAILDDEFVRISSTVHLVQESSDGTVKVLVRLQDGHEVECVIIDHTKREDNNESGRLTLCVSSQVGCAMKCSFCATGTLGLSGNLLAGEILEQIWHARQIRPGITNIVFMGMGEPLENYENLVAAIHGITDVYRFGIGDNSVTVSTVGMVQNIYRLMEDCPSVHLALSLHAPNQRIREQIVPTAKNWPIEKLMAAVDHFNKNQKYSGRKKGRIMIEYILIKDVNVSEECAHELGQLLKTRNCMINLIPFNSFEGNKYEEPSEDEVDKFHQIVSSYGIITIKRKHHGRDIAGACGQLAKVVKDIEDTLDSPSISLKSISKSSPDPSTHAGYLPMIAVGVFSIALLVSLYRLRK